MGTYAILLFGVYARVIVLVVVLVDSRCKTIDSTCSQVQEVDSDTDFSEEEVPDGAEPCDIIDLDLWAEE